MTIATKFRDGLMGKQHVKNIEDLLAAVSGLIPLQTQVVSSPVATLSFIAGIDGTYDGYEVRIHNAIPSSDGQTFQMVTSADGGANFATTNYTTLAFAQHSANPPTSPPSYGGATNTIELSPTSVVGSAANEVGWSGVIRLIRPSVAQHFTCSFDGVYVDTSGNLARVAGSGRQGSAAIVNAVRFKYGSGNIASCVATLYGVKR